MSSVPTAAPGAGGEPAAPRRRHLWISAAIVLAAVLLLGILGYGLKLDQTKVPPAIINQTALPFRVAFVQGESLLPAVKGDHFTLADLAGRPAIVNFWASWCVSCREEARELEKFWQAHRSEVQMVGIAIQDQKEDAKRFAAYFGKTYLIGLDEDGKAAIDYGVSGVPETFFIDKAGIIRHKEIGPVDAALLAKLLPKIQ